MTGQYLSSTLHPVGSSDDHLSTLKDMPGVPARNYCNFPDRFNAVSKAGHNYRNDLFHRVLAVVARMAKLPEGHELHLDRELASKAMDFLAKIHDSTDVSSPQVINEDGDALTFTWSDADKKLYLIIEKELVSAEIRRAHRGLVANENLGGDDGFDLSRLAGLLNVRYRAGSLR